MGCSGFRMGAENMSGGGSPHGGHMAPSFQTLHSLQACMPEEGLEQSRAAPTGRTGTHRLVDTVMLAARMLPPKFPGGAFAPYETGG